MTNLSAPTCDDLFGEDGYTCVERTVCDRWRHGVYIRQVFHRAADNSFWSASYCLSTNGETNGLRDGDADIIRVHPVETVVVQYLE